MLAIPRCVVARRSKARSAEASIATTQRGMASIAEHREMASASGIVKAERHN
jgi:hypothetical protein